MFSLTTRKLRDRPRELLYDPAVLLLAIYSKKKKKTNKPTKHTNSKRFIDPDSDQYP